LFNAAGKTYFVLEHKVASKYHAAGESQKIIVNQIELGRDASCQVRFDESFATVSRRHAAIVKNGENYTLVPLSSTNTTFLNGRPVQKEWYLQSGDEIQLSVNGPKMGFIIPQGKQALVSGINFTKRFSLFRQQALRPYKQAITILTCSLALIILGFVGWNYWQYNQWQKDIADKNEKIGRLIDNNDSIKYQLDSISKLKPRVVTRVVTQRPASNEIAELIEQCKDDIYFLQVTGVYLTNGSENAQITKHNSEGKEEAYSWSGTGFLLNDGRFVTARHCIQFWRFETNEEVLSQIMIADNNPNIKIVATIEAFSRTGKRLSFHSSDFTYSDRYDVKKQIGTNEDGIPIYLTSAFYANNEKFYSTDWAYVQTSARGKISMDRDLSNKLSSGTELHVLGFPGKIGILDTPSTINPAYNKFSVAQDGLDNSGCFLHTRGTDHGNSGGPIFTQKGNELVVVGIVSRGSMKSEEYNHGVPISVIY
jgi:hypothetical protein